jgi:hypothetical protein
MVTPDKDIKVPKAIRNMLYTDEEVIASICQSRLKQRVSPASLFITNHRILCYRPSNFGLRNSIEDYHYKDIANFKVDRGILWATINVKQRFSGNDLILGNLPKGNIDIISRLVQEAIRRIGEGDKPGSVAVAGLQSDDPMKVLKLRYARGEITKEEFEEMKQLLE